jgi:uncharacterized membrane protein YraQ (UPF0718 family)/copper chaperone CopZ
MVQNTWSIFLELAPWLLLGMAVAGVLHTLLPAGLVKRQLQGTGGVVKAVALGVPLPLCSCGVIPAGLGLKRDGASDGASVGFMISTPQTGVDSILVCASFLGWPFTVFKVVTAGVTGLLGGWLTDRLGGPRVELGSGGSTAADTQPGWREGVGHALSVLQTIWGWLLIGVLASAAIQTWMPPTMFQHTQAWGGMLAILGVLLISLPLYVCATASVPIAAALVAGGMPVGAGLVFLMAGPATNVATMGAILRGFGARILGIYLGTIIVCSVVAADIFNRWVDPVWTQQVGHGHHGGPVATLSAVVLMALIAKFAMDDVRRHLAIRSPSAQDTLEFVVEGMTCGGCVSRLEGVLRGVDGVDQVLVTLEPGSARVSGDVDATRIESVIRDAGFGVGS